MSRLRQTIVRLRKEAQKRAAMLTTFNECEMSAVMALRQQYKEAFEKKHGVKLGFSSFLTKAAVSALQELPTVNARIDGEEIVYARHYDIDMALSTHTGHMFQEMRDYEKKSFAEIEKTQSDPDAKSHDGTLALPP